MASRCYQCFRPRSLCFCDAIPRIENRTEVVILQHVGERSHAFNTARIVRQALCRCDVITDHNQQLGQHRISLRPKAGLIYPQPGAPRLDRLAVQDRPEQLVIIDGTWHQAKTIVRDVPQLQRLPCYRLAPSEPGQYRIRREPDAQSLSTLEATVAALRALEPDTAGLDQLLDSFRKMVDEQLERSGDRSQWRKKRRRGRPGCVLPDRLFGATCNLVVAYGESPPAQRGSRRGPAEPVNWAAQRLGSNERFYCGIHCESLLPDKVLRHMRLTPAEVENGMSLDEFGRRWSEFLRPDDVLIVYHQRTFRLLQQVRARKPRCLVLKSIFNRRKSGSQVHVEVGDLPAKESQNGLRSLEGLLASEGVEVPGIEGPNRAMDRLSMAVAFVEHILAKQREGQFLGA